MMVEINPEIQSEQSTIEQVQQKVQSPKVARLFQVAIKMGTIKPGWSCIDYMRYAAQHHGWESTCISGPKGTLKSNLELQHGKAIYGGNMNLVRKHFVTERKQLFELIDYAIENEINIPWIGVDDMAVLFPASLYFTHRKLYSKMQSGWESFRTVMNNFEFSCVIKRKVASFILEDITGDIKTYFPVAFKDDYIKGHYDYRRWLWLRNLKDPTTDVAKLIGVEDIPFPVMPESLQIDPELKSGTFICGGISYKGEDFYLNHACLTGIERNDFKDYWNNRLGLAKTAFKEFLPLFNEQLSPKHKAAPEPAAPIPAPSSQEASSVFSEMGRRSGAARRRNRERLQELLEENDKAKSNPAGSTDNPN